MAPSDWTPTFSVYRSETDTKPLAWSASFTTQVIAREQAERHGLKAFVIRRSVWTVMGERPRGAVVFTKG